MKILKAKAISFLISIIIFSLLSLIYTVLIFKQTKISNSFLFVQSKILIGAVSFFSLGLISSLIEKKNGLISNFLTGLIVCFLLSIIKLISKETIDLFVWIKYSIYILFSTLGGIIGVLKKN